MKPDDPVVSDEEMSQMLGPVVQAVAAYGRAESNRMGAVIILSAYGVVESRCRALIRAAVKRGLEMAAEVGGDPNLTSAICKQRILALAERVGKEGRS